jgi:hypothetical protein
MDVEFKDWNGELQYLTANWWNNIGSQNLYLCPMGAVWVLSVKNYYSGQRHYRGKDHYVLKYSIHNSRLGIGINVRG